MALFVGVMLAFTRRTDGDRGGLDRDRASYPTVTIVVAVLYALFLNKGPSLRGA
jgi:hypothetical protein